MVKFYTSNHSYDYPFATVTLAYFLRYPNPYSRHVLSTDVLERSFDPVTQRLTTTRLHLKRSRIPTAVLKLVPRGFLQANNDGNRENYILEKSVVDVKEGWMKTESRGLEMRMVLDVVERQTYLRNQPSPDASGNRPSLFDDMKERHPDVRTDVTTTVTLHSRLGQRLRQNRPFSDAADADTPRSNFLTRWSQAGLQTSIEAIGLNRTSKSQPNAKEGMKVVLQRLQQGGLVAVLEGMRKDREAGMELTGATAPRP